jgi:uncharacterized iron-regulated membrane protein
VQLRKLVTARNLYAVHRWISLLTVLQLVLWATSGLVFSLTPARSITSALAEGAHDRHLISDPWLGPGEILSHVPDEHRSSVFRLELRRSGESSVWIVRSGTWIGRYDAVTGAERPLDEAEAAAIASEDQEGHPVAREVVRYDESPPIEYRGRPLPAYRVLLDDAESTAVWVDARTGDVTARRTDRWRVYDFFWALHIMDYGAREDTHHPLLVAFAVLTELTALTGLVLWIRRIPRKRKETAPAP